MNDTHRTVSDIIAKIKSILSDCYSEHEIQSLIYLIFEYLLKYTKIDLHINSNNIISKRIRKTKKSRTNTS